MPEDVEWAVVFQDEGVFGLRTEIAKVLTLSGVRPVVKASQRFGAFKIYASVNPETGCKSMMRAEHCNIKTFNRHLRQLSRRYKGKKVLLVMDRAGWHTSPKVKKPENVEFAYLPPYCPELNPVENVWKEMKKGNKNTRFETLEDLAGSLVSWTHRRCTENIKSVSGYNWIMNVIDEVRTLHWIGYL